MNDLHINITLGGREGYTFILDCSKNSSLLTVNLNNGNAIRRLLNTSVVRADEKYVGSYESDLVYSWKGTKKGYATTGADGVALGKCHCAHRTIPLT